MNKYQEQLKQIRKRIAELEQKAKWVESQIAPVEQEPVKPRRGRRKVNETV